MMRGPIFVSIIALIGIFFASIAARWVWSSMTESHVIESQYMALVVSETRPAEKARIMPNEATVVALVGNVDRERRGAWTPINVDDRVQADDLVRTGPNSWMDLRMGDRARLTIAEETQVKIAELTAAVHRFEIRRGRVAAAYDSDGERVIKIEAEKLDAYAETKSAHFSVMNTESSFAVATETGSVNLNSASSEIEVAEGQQSVGSGTQAPSVASNIPMRVLLRIASANQFREANARKSGFGNGAHASYCSTIEGTATQGAQVKIDGVEAKVGMEGNFRVALGGGQRKEAVEISVIDVLGREDSQLVQCKAAGGKELEFKPPKVGKSEKQISKNRNQTVRPGPKEIKSLNIDWGE